jgi:carbon monoxide dehydrogenase subunit G
MQLEHEFEVPVPVEQAWDVLLDVERIAPCMPGATVESFDGEVVKGRVKVKVGPIQVTYGGTAKFTEKDTEGHRVVIEASGKEARGAGTANATIIGTLLPQGSSTKVTVSTDLAITGKPAQFGRGVMVEVGNKLIGQFATCLAQEISGGAPAPAPAAAAAGEAAAPTAAAAAPPLRPVPEAEPINLLQTAGMPVLKRLLPLVVGVIALVVVWRMVRGRRG